MSEQEYNRYLILESKEELKTRFKNHVLQFVLTNSPTIQQTQEFAVKTAQKMLKTTDNITINGFVDFAQALHTFYFANISIDYVIFEHFKKQDKGEI